MFILIKLKCIVYKVLLKILLYVWITFTFFEISLLTHCLKKKQKNCCFIFVYYQLMMKRSIGNKPR